MRNPRKPSWFDYLAVVFFLGMSPYIISVTEWDTTRDIALHLLQLSLYLLAFALSAHTIWKWHRRIK